MVNVISGTEKTTIEGVLPIYKPVGITTFDVIRRLKSVLPGPKPAMGHTGTLDPIAEGVVIVLINKANKTGFMFENDYKEYKAEALLGFSSDTYDLDGDVQKSSSNVDVTQKEIIDVLKSLSGTYLQKPPVYSAVKYKGKPSYYWKRELGIEVDLPPRKVTVDNSFLSYSNNVVTFTSTVSKGTYIRKIISELGEKLGVGAVMKSLVRLKCGNITADKCINLDDISNYNNFIIAPNEYFRKYSHFKGDVFDKVKHGVQLNSADVDFVKTKVKGDYYPVFDNNGELLCFVENLDEVSLKYKRVLVA